MDKKDRCFVITPIGDETDPIRRHIDGIIEAVIKPALSDKYEVVVSHKISEPGIITRQIIKEIYEDKLVIVNLTDRNPNVIYELAFRHSLGKPVISIAEYGTGLPADIISNRTIFYKNDVKGTLELKEEIIKAESEIDFEKLSSPIYDMLKEIGQEINILNNKEITGNGKSENIDMLEYILERLGKIENMIAKNEPRRDRKISFSFNNIVYVYETVKDMDVSVEIKRRIIKTLFMDEDIYHRYNMEIIDVIVINKQIRIIFNSRAAEYMINELGNKLLARLHDIVGVGVKLIDLIKY